jgi:iron complex transport system substrate-binding protein
MRCTLAHGLCAAALLLGATTPVFAEPISFTDQEGREVTLAKPAERIVTIPMPMASSVIAIDGRTGSLVGMNPVSKDAITEGILGKIFPEARDINDSVTDANFIPNVEELAAVDPDLVIQWGGRGGDLVDPITNAGLTTMLILYGTEELTRGYMSMTAEALGKPERFVEHVAWRDKVMNEIEARTKDIPEGDRPKVLHFGRILNGMTASGSGNNYTDWYINLVGAQNAAADLDGSKPVNAEQVAAWDPDIITLNNFEPGLTVQAVYDDPVLSLTSAARNHRVYRMPLGGYRWDPPNQESPLTWMWLANLVHPEIFEFDLRSEMKSAYKSLYDYELSEADIDSILWMDMQGDAVNYGSFKAE